MPRTRLNLLPALLAILLGTTVAIAAHGRTWSTHAGQSGWSARAFALIVIAGCALVALLLALTVWRHQAGGLIWQVGGTALGALILTAIAVITAALLYQHFTPPLCNPCRTVLVTGSGGGGAAVGTADNNGPAAQGKQIGLKSVHNHPHSTSLLLVWLALGTFIVGTAIWIWRQRLAGRTLSIWRQGRTRHRQPDIPSDVSKPTFDETGLAKTASRYIEATLDDLRHEPDLRRAIIACYARMEQLFAHLGRPRAGWETPFEFLRRTNNEAGQPLDRLTVLYEEAQFSPHPIDERRRQEAITALASLRDQLQAAPTGRGPRLRQ
jgi:Domain of unknown function (DUF4129)